jgi:5'-3' exonuclease
MIGGVKDRLMLLDTASLYFRAFYGVPDTVVGPDGTPVNAARGLLDIVARLVTEFRPTRLVACWDDSWRPAWRTALIPSYKQHRVARVTAEGVSIEETPAALDAQIPLIREELGALGIPILGAADHEADDVIGSLATRASVPVDVVTGDRDLFQLADDDADVRIVYTARGMSKLEIVTSAAVEQRYGVRADQYADFAVLRGDPSDGLPGVQGVGDKTAAALIREYGDLARIVAVASDPDAPLSSSVRARLLDACDYLAAAPRVVRVVRDLDFDDVDDRLGPLDEDHRRRVTELAERAGLGGAADRAIAAIDGTAG